MKYLCLVYLDEKVLNAMPKEVFEPFSAEHVALDEELRRNGQSILAEALQPVSTAVTVRLRNGKLSTTDGPFAETKEQLGGYYLIDVPNLDAALKWAAKCPGIKGGSIEVRPLGIITATDGSIAAMQQ